MTESANRRTEIEAWWALIVRILAFAVGVSILLIETLGGGNRLYIIVAGIGLCGPVVANSVATVFASIRGGEQSE